MKGLLFGLVLLNATSAFAATTADFLNEISERLANVCHRTVIHRHFSETKHSFIDGKLAYETIYVNVSKMGIIGFTNTLSNACQLTTLESRTLRNDVLVDIARENFPEADWTTKKLLRGWSGWSLDDTDAKIGDIYDFNKSFKLQ